MAKANHNLVANNVAAAVHGHLKCKLCQAFIADMMMRMLTNHAGYLDVKAICAQTAVRDNPSKPTRFCSSKYCRRQPPRMSVAKKFASHRKFASREHVAFIDSDLSSMDDFQPNGDRWTLRPSGAGTLTFLNPKFHMATADIFAGVTAASEQDRIPSHGQFAGGDCCARATRH